MLRWKFGCIILHLGSDHVDFVKVDGSSPFNPTINTDISWYKEAHPLRWAFLYACKFSLKPRPFAAYLQEYTGGRPGGFSALVDG